MSFSFLFEMAWKSALISGAALLLVAVLRSRSAADRGAVLRLGVVLLLLLPLIALLFPALVIETPAPLPAADLAPAAYADADLAALPVAGGPAASSSWDDPGLLFFLLYLGGVAMVGGRLAAGLWTLRRWTAAAREVTSPAWLHAMRRAGGDTDGIRLLVSEEARSPLSWGWRRPAILLDSDTLAQPEDADAILAHEMAHIARRDWATLVASRIALSLFWFNPLVWLLDREVTQRAEEAADSEAVGTVEPARYAQTLLDWARQSGCAALPANAIAAREPGLARRVRAILEGGMAPRSGSGWTVAAMAACVAIAAPVAALEFIPEAPEAPDAPEAPAAPPPPPAAVAVIADRASPPPVPRAPLSPPAAAEMPPPPPMALARPVPPVPPVARAVAAAAVAEAVRAEAVIDAEAIRADVEAALVGAGRSVELARVEAHRAAEHAVHAAAKARSHGADGMMRGAEGMERGARHMAQEARRLRDRDYRERKIAEEAARGKRVTHEQLIEAADDMEEGSRDMLEGARDMREAAEEMRRGD